MCRHQQDEPTKLSENRPMDHRPHSLQSRTLKSCKPAGAKPALVPIYEERGPIMMMIRLAIATYVIAALAGTPFPANAKNHKHSRHHVATTGPANYPTTGPYPTAGVTMPRPGTYGSSGVAIGTVTAPSIGTYSWPSVGVTNARPTWSNTMPAAR